MAWLYVWNPKETKNKLLEIIRKFNEVIGFRINMQRSKVFLHLSVVQSLNSVQLFKNSVDGSMPGFPVLHHLLELAQTHVHWIHDAIQPSHPLSSPSALKLSQHQGLFYWVGSSHQVAEVLELQFPHPFFQYLGLISFTIDWFDLLAVQGTLKFSPIPQFKSINSSTLSLPYGPTLTPITDCWTNHNFDYIWTFVGKVISLLLNTCLGLT